MWDTWKSRFGFAVDVLKESGHEYGVDRASRMAAAISYRVVFAAAPLLIISVAILGVVVDNAQEEIFRRISQLVGADLAEFLIDFLTSAREIGDAAGVVGAVLLFWTATSLFMEMQHDLNDIFDVPYERTAGVFAFIKIRGIGFLWAFGLGLAMIAVLLVNVIWRWLGGLFPTNLEPVHRILGYVTPVISILVLPVIFALIFRTMTVAKIRRRAVMWGGVFTSIVFLATAYGVGIYFSWDRGTTALTVASAFFVVLLSAYVLANVFLFGAVVTRVVNDYLEEGEVLSPAHRLERMSSSSRVVVSEPPPTGAKTAVLAFLAGLFVAFRRNRP